MSTSQYYKHQSKLEKFKENLLAYAIADFLWVYVAHIMKIFYPVLFF